MNLANTLSSPKLNSRRSWFDYRSVWRWHFYAGLFCIPFVLLLSVTGGIYLFRPQIERWLDRPYDSLVFAGPRTPAALQVQAALAAVPGSNLHFYELPRTEHSAARVIVGKGAEEYRVYVHPVSLQILKVIREDSRPMRILFRLHGELLMGDKGSLIVELAASWTVILILTGIYLWWPRQAEKLAGILYFRVNQGRRIFWRDLHSVTGIWISGFALFLLLTGLPWAKSWGNYLKAARKLTGTQVAKQDWTNGRSSEFAERMAMNDSEHAMHEGHHGHVMLKSFEDLDRIVAKVSPLNLAFPVLISPPSGRNHTWTAKSDSQNRPLRTSLTLDGETGSILERQDFSQRHWIDRLVGTGVAAHEGQLFGIWNQMLGLLTAAGLILMSISAVILWWRRRGVGVLGAPLPIQDKKPSLLLIAIVLVLGIYLPVFGLSLLFVLCIERLVLRRIPIANRWLGLEAH